MRTDCRPSPACSLEPGGIKGAGDKQRLCLFNVTTGSTAGRRKGESWRSMMADELRCCGRPPRPLAPPPPSPMGNGEHAIAAEPSMVRLAREAVLCRRMISRVSVFLGWYRGADRPVDEFTESRSVYTAHQLHLAIMGLAAGQRGNVRTRCE